MCPSCHSSFSRTSTHSAPASPSAWAASEVRAAFARWPHGTVERLQRLAVRFRSDPVVQFNYGSALFCRGYLSDAEQAFRAAKSTGLDTRYEITADNILHPEFFQG